MKFHHDGIACRSIEEDKKFYGMLGFTQEGKVFEDELQKIRGMFMVNLSGMRVELLEALTDDSPIKPYLSKSCKIYHHAFTCNELFEEQINHLLEHGAMIGSPPKPSVAFGGRKITFLVLPNSLLIELIEGFFPLAS